MRDDKAHEEVMAWVQAEKSPVLYLTGVSGSGESSLLKAWAVPELEARGWRVVSLRGFDDSAAALTCGVLEPGSIWERPPAEPEDARSLLEKASD